MAMQWNRNAAREILKSPAVRADIQRRANRVAAAAGPGFEAWARSGRNRARASVEASTYEARKKNSRENTLLRALEAGR